MGGLTVPSVVAMRIVPPFSVMANLPSGRAVTAQGLANPPEARKHFEAALALIDGLLPDFRNYRSTQQLRGEIAQELAARR